MKTSESHPIRLDFVTSKDYPVLNRLGMTFAPGKMEQNAVSGHWNRDLENDLMRLKNHYKIDTLVSLVEYEELGRLRIEDLPEACKSQRIVLVQFPIKDGSTPTSVEEFTQLIGWIGGRLNEGGTVAVHCNEGLGRTGLTAACAIVAISDGKIDGRRAIEMARRARTRTVETHGQEKFVINFVNHWRVAR